MTENQPTNQDEQQSLLKYLESDELIKETRALNLDKPALEIPKISTNSRILRSSRETSPSKSTSAPLKYSSVKLQTKKHKRYSEDPQNPQNYTKKQQKEDLKRAIREEIEQKMEAAGENNTKPRLPYPIALKGKKTKRITTEKGTYITYTSNIIVGIHGRERFDVQLQNPKMVFKVS